MTTLKIDEYAAIRHFFQISTNKIDQKISKVMENFNNTFNSFNLIYRELPTNNRK